MFARPGFIRPPSSSAGGAHKDYIGPDIHVLHNWIAADITALYALSVTAADVGKVAQVISTASFYILEDDSPITWAALGGSSVGAAFKAYRQGSEQTFSAAAAKSTYLSTLYNYEACFDSTNSRFTANRAGVYHFDARVAGAIPAGSWLSIYKNGVEYTRGQEVTATGNNAVTISTDVDMIAGDYVEVFARGVFTTVTSAANFLHMFSGHLVGRVNPGNMSNVAFEARAGANQTLTAGVDTKITYSTETYDISGNFDLANSRFIAPSSGIFHFDAQVAAPFTAGGRIQLWKNGGQWTLYEIQSTMVTTPISADIQLVTGDYVEVYGKNNTGITTAKFSTTHRFSGHKVA